MNAKVNNCQTVRSSLVGVGGGRETQVAYSLQNLCENIKKSSRGGDLPILMSV